VKIKDIPAAAIDVPLKLTTARRVLKLDTPDWLSPMMRYQEFHSADCASRELSVPRVSPKTT
jgi:hypothetical protein